MRKGWNRRGGKVRNMDHIVSPKVARIYGLSTGQEIREVEVRFAAVEDGDKAVDNFVDFKQTFEGYLEAVEKAASCYEVMEKGIEGTIELARPEPYKCTRHQLKDKALERELFLGMRILAGGRHSQRLTRFMVRL